MLLLTRRIGQSFTIQPDSRVALTEPLETLFRDGPIEVVVSRIIEDEVKIGIVAHRDLAILRRELDRNPQIISAFPSSTQLRKQQSSQSHAVLARNVNQQRSRQQWSMPQLAKASGLSLTTLSAIEQGRGIICLEDLDSLATAFGIETSHLLKS